MLKVDRIEDRAVVCFDSQMTQINVPKYRLPMGIKPGDSISMDSMGMYRIVTDTKEPARKGKRFIR